MTDIDMWNYYLLQQLPDIRLFLLIYFTFNLFFLICVTLIVILFFCFVLFLLVLQINIILNEDKVCQLLLTKGNILKNVVTIFMILIFINGVSYIVSHFYANYSIKTITAKMDFFYLMKPLLGPKTFFKISFCAMIRYWSLPDCRPPGWWGACTGRRSGDNSSPPLDVSPTQAYSGHTLK